MNSKKNSKSLSQISQKSHKKAKPIVVNIQEELEKLDKSSINAVYQDNKIQVQFIDKNFGVVDGEAILNQDQQLLFQFFLKREQLACFNYNELRSYDKYIRKKNKELSISEQFQGVHKYLRENIYKRVQQDNIYSFFNQFTLVGNYKIGIFLVVFIALFFRYLVSLGNYSGQNDPPFYGDYEAQRHWFEITYHLNPQEWYQNSTYNNRSQWPLDYPPLTAYHSQVLGYLSNKFDSKSVELVKSKGYETPEHKVFMRMTVLVSDLLTFIPAILLYIFQEYHSFNFSIKMLISLIILQSPLFILIDHGHFQYNCVMHGFIVLAVYNLKRNRINIASIFFVFALNFKQMALYFALPLFFFILAKHYQNSKSEKNIFLRFFKFTFSVLGTGIVVIATFTILWFPWLQSKELFLGVIQGIFPFKRGLYQLKVGTFWCITDTIIKWHQRFDETKLALFASGLTLLASLPSQFALLYKPSFKNFQLTLFIVSMSFYLYAYHVHEKTILLPLIGLSFNIRYFSNYFADFNIIALFTCMALLDEDNQELQYGVILIGYFYFISPALKFLNVALPNMMFRFTKREKNKNNSIFYSFIYYMDVLYDNFLRYLIYLSMFALKICYIFVKPPQNLQYLWHLLIATLGYFLFNFLFLRAYFILFYNIGSNNEVQEGEDKKEKEE